MQEQFALAVSLQQNGRYLEARKLYEQVLDAHPRHFDSLHLLGVLLLQTQDPRRATALFARALAAKPHDARVHYHLGLALQQCGELAPALNSYEQAIRLDAEFGEAFANRGLALKSLGRPLEALASFERAIALRPALAEAHFNQALTLHELGRREEALPAYDRALALNPRHAEAHLSRGNVLRELGNWEAAKASFEQALALDPRDARAHCNLGALHQERQLLEEALASYDLALAARPDYAPAHVNRGLALLTRGELAEGWRENEWRARREFDQPHWTGAQSLAGKTILLHAEQGFGDTLQFCRYVPLVARLAGQVLLEVPPALRRLLGSLAGGAQLVESGAQRLCDYHCSLLSLPLAFGTTLATIPAQVPYLHADPDAAAGWRASLGVAQRPRVGLVWSSGVRPDQPAQWADHRRNVALAEFAALRTCAVDFFSLQKGEPAASDLGRLQSRGWDGPAIADHTARLADFADTAALMANLDLVITVDTATAHLAGALGRRVWILNRFDTCWRWLLHREDSPWYPSAKLYRQSRAGQWGDVIERVREDLEAFARLR